MNIRKALVTGGAGFIGTTLVERLLSEGVEVVVLDNFSSATTAPEALARGHPAADRMKLVKGDCTISNDIEASLDGVDTVFHLAANPEVRLDLSNEETCVQQNVIATFKMLEAFKRSGATTFVFTSSSTVYGEPSLIPTPEDYGPLIPISVYGASKLASEALISAYSKNTGKRGVIFRLANIVGERSRHGVVPDFIRKLTRDSSVLEVLGDGSQTKSYLHVDDCVSGILMGTLQAKSQVSIFNVGAMDFIPVSRIATIVATLMGLPQPKMRFTGGVDNGRGWVGDVKTMLLDVSNLVALGWRPTLTSEESVRLAVSRSLEQARRYKIPFASPEVKAKEGS